MNTTAAATEAKVTVATIRDWARRGIIAATKVAGRWVINATSLARRITIGKRKARRMPQPPIHLTSKTTRIRGHIGVLGPADALKAAFEAGRPVTLDGKFSGERVYLGHSRQTYGDYGITMETIGLDRELGEAPGLPGVFGAVYLVDFTRLNEAPRIAALVAAADAKAAQAAAEAEQRAAAEDARLDALDREEY